MSLHHLLVHGRVGRMCIVWWEGIPLDCLTYPTVQSDKTISGTILGCVDKESHWTI